MARAAVAVEANGAAKAVATSCARALSSTSKSSTPLSQYGGVHGSKGTAGSSKMWRNKPLLRREGDKIFKTGLEASELLIAEAGRKDGEAREFLASWESMVTSLSSVFDRHPKYAWVMKLLLEAERTISFRVAWIDDSGISRVNRGFRIQYSSALGPYEGPTVFTERLSYSVCKAKVGRVYGLAAKPGTYSSPVLCSSFPHQAFDATFRNALSGKVRWHARD